MYINKINKKYLVIFSLLFFIIFSFVFLHSDYANPKNNKMIFGVSFSPYYSRYLGLDVNEVYKFILDDLNFKHLRLTARWDEIEPFQNKFNFSELDYLMNEAAKRGVKVVLVIGQKTPRWPECNVPIWTENLSDEKYYLALNNYLKNVVEHYKNNVALESWQVENEPFLKFGKLCRSLDSEKLNKEIMTVKNVDPERSVLITDSGELSMWSRTAKVGEKFGSTVYRVVWNKYLGYLNYDFLPANFYRFRALMYGLDLKNVFVAELQAEPWMPDLEMSVDNIPEQMKSMSLNRLKKQVVFAQKTGFSRSYFWGVEWWYWLKVHGNDDFSNYIKELLK